jgi:hypothetical protein
MHRTGNIQFCMHSPIWLNLKPAESEKLVDTIHTRNAAS